jgi:hypothetical protein
MILESHKLGCAHWLIDVLEIDITTIESKVLLELIIRPFKVHTICGNFASLTEDGAALEGCIPQERIPLQHHLVVLSWRQQRRYCQCPYREDTSLISTIAILEGVGVD